MGLREGLLVAPLFNGRILRSNKLTAGSIDPLYPSSSKSFVPVTIEMVSDRPVQVYYHPLCLFCRRVLYALAFKGVAAELVLVDLANPSPRFLEVSNTRKIPAVVVWKGGKEFHLTESLRIMEYIDTEYHGPALYPRELNNSVDALKKARIDADIANYVDSVVGKLYPFLEQRATAKDISDLKALLSKLNTDFLVNGQHFAHSLMDSFDHITIADIALLPLIEVLSAWRDSVFVEVLEQDLAGLWKWFECMRVQPWAARNYLGEQPARNYLQIRKGLHPKLTLPVSLYL